MMELYDRPVGSERGGYDMKKIGYRLGMLFLFILLSTACSNTAAVTTEEETVIPVETAQVETGLLQEVKKVIGNATPNLQVSVYSELSGKLAEVRVQKGEKVEKGQIIAVLHQEDFANGVAQAEAQLKSAKANLAQAEAGQQSGMIQAENQLKQAQSVYDNAKVNVERMKQLYEEEAIAKQQLEQAENSFIQAEASFHIAKESYETAKRTENIQVLKAQVETAVAALNNAKQSLNKTFIKAPADGTIVQITADPGELISPQKPFATLIDIRSITVQGMISEEELRLIKEGTEIDAYVPVLDQKQKGKVTFVSPLADSQTKNYPIEVTLDNPNEDIKAGMMVELYLQDSDKMKDILVPIDALVKEEQDTFVFVVKDQVVEKRKITIKEEGIEKAAIAEGLQSGEIVVTKGQINLQDGDRIRIIEGGETR